MKKTSTNTKAIVLKSTYDNKSHILSLKLVETRDTGVWNQDLDSVSLEGMPENIRQVVIQTMRYAFAVANGTKPKAKQGDNPSLSENLQRVLTHAASGGNKDVKETVKKTETHSSNDLKDKAVAKTPESLQTTLPEREEA